MILAILEKASNPNDKNKISIYQFPEGADEEENKQNKKLKERIPFAVIGSNAVLLWI